MGTKPGTASARDKAIAQNKRRATVERAPKDVGGRAEYLGVLPRYLAMGMGWTTRAMRQRRGGE